MDIGKGVIRVITTIFFIIALLIYIGAAAKAGTKPHGLTGWAGNSMEISALIGSFITLILINIMRLKLGITMVMTNKNVEYQYIFLMFFSLVLISFCLLAMRFYWLGAVFFVVGFAGSGVIKQRMWRIFTEIREADHVVYRSRLIKSGLFIGGLSLLAFFGSSSVSFLYKLSSAVFYGYMISSFIIGFIVVRDYFAPAINAASGWVDSQQKLEAEVTQRAQENDRISRANYGVGSAPMVAPKSDLGVAQLGAALLLLSILLSAIVVGVFMIPFYIYVLNTKRVTVIEPVAA